ncbi:uncharacterized protein MEPE_03342 [Melanopsichium pennsylvanicum]|uniref:Uncharacterized protein n=2 Tax=Melanopsichium pennsylvanicum TaxID=63383 RepID=A0AAJ4XM23_9BASI|nr:uncharacterized protein BN887_00379 [Melanopsichium pennsylvanicum 4]SNX84633.1 uncharacterized protein MEPE_03342 [Melanopsichium pennsylvanicum]
MSASTYERPFWLSQNGVRLAEELPVHYSNDRIPLTKVIVSGVQGDRFQFRISKDEYPYGAHCYFRGWEKHSWQYLFDALPDFAYLERHINPAVTQLADPFWQCQFPTWEFGKARFVWVVVIKRTEGGLCEKSGQQVIFNLKAQPRNWQVANADRYLIQRLESLSLGPTVKTEVPTSHQQQEPSSLPALTPPPLSPAQPSTVTIQSSSAKPFPAAEPSTSAVFDPFAAARTASETRRFAPTPASSSRPSSSTRPPLIPAANERKQLNHPVTPDVGTGKPAMRGLPRDSQRRPRTLILQSVQTSQPPGPPHHRADPFTTSPIRFEDTDPKDSKPSSASLSGPIPSLRSEPDILARSQPSPVFNPPPIRRRRSRPISLDDEEWQEVEENDDHDIPLPEFVPPPGSAANDSSRASTVESQSPRRSKRIQEKQRRASSSAGPDEVDLTPVKPTIDAEVLEPFFHLWDVPMTANPYLRFVLTVEHYERRYSSPESEQLEEDTNERDEEDMRRNPQDWIQVVEMPHCIRLLAGQDIRPVRRHLDTDALISAVGAALATPAARTTSSPKLKGRAPPKWLGIPCEKRNNVGYADTALQQKHLAVCQKRIEAAKKAWEDFNPKKAKCKSRSVSR